MKAGPATLAGVLAGLLAAPAVAPAQSASASASASAGGDYTARFAAVCTACHGAQGRSSMALTPSLAGQPSFYAITQLFLFRQGRRDNAAMAAIAKDMTDTDLRGFSDVIGKLPPAPPAEVAPVDDKRFARGEAIAREHRCASCHGNDYAGAQQVPRLAQQREDYLLLALRGFKEGKRVGYTQAMNEVLAGVAPDQLADLAHHLAHIGVR